MKRVFIKDVWLNECNHLAGFIENILDKKFLCFIVLRDVSGKIQLTINKNDHPELVDVVSKLTVDSVVHVEGRVIENENVKLNGIEMLVDKLQIDTIAAPSPIVAPKGEGAAMVSICNLSTSISIPFNFTFSLTSYK